MPFTSRVELRETIDCRDTDSRDRVRVVFDDDTYLVLGINYTFWDRLERPLHRRLHVDLELTPKAVVDQLRQEAFGPLTYHMPRAKRKIFVPDMIRLFVWSDDKGLWSKKPGDLTIVAWVLWSDDQIVISDRVNTPTSLPGFVTSIDYTNS